MVAKANNFEAFWERFKKVQIFSENGLDLLKKLDSKNSLFYIDPPYPETDQKYKHRFSNKDFNQLVSTLKTIKGKFILSCYQKPWMNFKGFLVFNKKTYISANANSNQDRKKEEDIDRIECLVLNYQPPNTQIEMI